MEGEISRRSFLKNSAIALGTVAVCDFTALLSACCTTEHQVFTEDISVNGLLKIYSKINQGNYGKIGIKLHTGSHGPNLLPIELSRACSHIF